MTSRTLRVAIVCWGLTAACAHRRGYEVADFHVDWGDDHTFLVWDARPPSMCCMPLVPVVQVKASKVSTPQGPCFDGLYNPERVPLNASMASASVQVFLLCPDAADDVAKAVFRMLVRTPSGDQRLEFSVIQSTPGAAEIVVADGPHGRVLIPTTHRFADTPSYLDLCSPSVS